MEIGEYNDLVRRGIAGFSPSVAWVEPEWHQNSQLAMDAEPALFTAPNSAVPAFLSNILYPKEINVLYAPMRSTEIYPEQKLGSWTDLTTQFPIVEMTGFVTSYGDFNNNGDAGANINWVPRQSYYFQTVIQYGEREIDMYALAKFDYVSKKNMSAAFVIAKFFNNANLFGIAGLQCYGIINDPSLVTPISPTTGVGGNTWALKTAQEIYNDFLAAFQQLNTQMGGLLTMDMAFTVTLPTTLLQYLNKVSAFNVTAKATIMAAFPNLKFVWVPEFATAAGNLMQLKIDEYDGTDTGMTAFTEKMRSHPIIPDLSSYKTKRSAGTWGAIIMRPIAIAQMLGI